MSQVSASVSMGAQTIVGAVASGVKMILRGGPLDGEQQIVQALPSTPGSVMYFNSPSYQTFDEDGNVVSQGLTEVYVLLGQGNAPTPADAWTSSWVFLFGTELPTPPPGTLVWMVGLSSLVASGLVPPKPIPPQMASLNGQTSMVINASDPIPGAIVVTLEGDTDLEMAWGGAEAGTVSMSVDAMLASEVNPSTVVGFAATTSMMVTPS